MRLTIFTNLLLALSVQSKTLHIDVNAPANTSITTPANTSITNETKNMLSTKITNICYDLQRERFSPLQGLWSDEPLKNLRYSNLSCSLEWSKYSCAHQGAPRHAEAAARRAFLPAACVLLEPEFDPNVFRPGRTIYFVGDSLIRQMFIAMGCMLEPHIVHQDVKWPSCELDEAKRWPCHETRNCIQCGPHSGFNSASIAFNNGASMRYGHGLGLLKPGDVVLFEPGIHDDSSDKVLLFKSKVPLKLLNNITSLWIITPQDAFKSNDRDGLYNPQYLQQKGHAGCQRVTKPVRSTAEWKAISGNPAVLQQLYGVVDFEGLSEQGDLKIGGGVGTYGDCQHYCMPGPPDVYAGAIFTMLKGESRV